MVWTVGTKLAGVVGRSSKNTCCKYIKKIFKKNAFERSRLVHDSVYNTGGRRTVCAVFARLDCRSIWKAIFFDRIPRPFLHRVLKMFSSFRTEVLVFFLPAVALGHRVTGSQKIGLLTKETSLVGANSDPAQRRVVLTMLHVRLTVRLCV